MSSQALPAKGEQLFRCLFQQASLGIAVEDLEGKILLANPALCSMLGYADDELTGMSCSQFATAEDSQDDWALFQQLRAGTIDHYSIEKRYVRKDGAPLWGRLNVSLLKEDDREYPLFFAFVENITERKQAEEALHQKEKELTETRHLAGIGSWLWDARTDRMIWSREVSLRIGHDPNSPAPKLKEQAGLFTPESWDRLQRSVQDAVQTGTSYQLDLELVKPLSEVRWVATRGEPLRDADGQIIGLRGTVQDITDRKLAAQELARLNDRFRLAMEASQSLGWEWDLKTGRNTWFGDLQAMFGVASNSFDGKVEDFFRRVHPEDQKIVAQAVADARQNRKPYGTEFRVVRLDGTVRWVAARGSFYYEANGGPVRMLGMAADVTKRKLTEKRLREYEKTVECSTDSITVIDREYRYLIANRTFLKLRNMTKEQAVGRLVPEVLNKEIFETVVKDKLDECFAGKIVTYELRYTYPEIGERDLLITYTPIEGGSGIDRVACIAQDITERKRAQDGLRESEQRLRLAIQAGRMYAFDWDVVTDEIVRSKESVAILNWKDPEHDTGRRFHARVHTDDEALYTGTEAKLTPENPAYQVCFRAVGCDGSITWLEDIGRAFFDAQRKMVRVTGMVADITERKRAEVKLRESEERFRLATQAGKMYAYEWDSASDLVTWTGAYGNILGLFDPAEQITRQQLAAIVHPDDRARFVSSVDNLTPENPTSQISYRVLRPDGSEIWLEKIGRASFDSQGKLSRVMGMVADITERKLAEAAVANVSRKLIAAQELERTRIGRELHDDIGQRLALVAVQLQQMRDDPLVFARVRRRLDALHKKVSEIAADTQSLSHELHSARLQYLGIAAAMRGFCREFGEQQKVKIDFKANDLPTPLSADISLCLFRVLQEALHNSAKHSGTQRFEVRLWGTADEIRLTVKDSGIGFDREAAKTRQGIGLISMEERLKLVYGTLSVESEPGRGTTIDARVPVSFASDTMRATG
jgi:PAS domain S-box-containing protein